MPEDIEKETGAETRKGSALPAPCGFGSAADFADEGLRRLASGSTTGLDWQDGRRGTALPGAPTRVDPPAREPDSDDLSQPGPVTDPEAEPAPEPGPDPAPTRAPVPAPRPRARPAPSAPRVTVRPAPPRVATPTGPRQQARGRILLRRALLVGAVVATIALVALATVVFLGRSGDTRTAGPGPSAVSRAAAVERIPAAAPSTGTYVLTRVLPNGDLQVSQWIRVTTPLSGIEVSAPLMEGSTTKVFATDVVVSADRTVVTGDRTVTGGTSVYGFVDPARTVRLRYVLHGTVTRSPSVKGRALAGATSLVVRYSAGTSDVSKVRITGARVLTAACRDSGDEQAEPTPCGSPTGRGWTVQLRAGQLRDVVMAQLDLS